MPLIGMVMLKEELRNSRGWLIEGSKAHIVALSS
jgi:hypothetical protein